MCEAEWHNCTPELLLHIFKMLDIMALRNCLFVNKKWKDIAEYIIQHRDLWPKLVEYEIGSNGTSFKTKSVLGWKDIFDNSVLWWDVRKANITHLHTYKVDVLKVNVYRDNLIVATGTSVKYYNIETFKEIRNIKMKCVDFEENDHMVVKVLREQSRKTLTLYGKISPEDFNLRDDTKKELEQYLYTYKLVGNCCYAINVRNTMMCFKWDQLQWHDKFISRSYLPPETVTLLHEYNNELYIMLNTGTIIWHDHVDEHNLIKIYSHRMPLYITDAPFLCHRFSVVFAVKTDRKLKFTHYDYEIDFTMEFPGLSCVAQHWEVLLIASTDGKIHLFMPRLMRTNGGIAEVSYQLKLDKRDKEIKSLHVYEVKGSHYLLAATSKSIYQLHITHPDLTI